MTRALFRLFDRLMGGQWGCPHGPLGWLAARLMVFGNRAMNELAVAALGVKQGESVLEIGFGPGDLLERIAKESGAGLVAGIDPSRSMVRAARRRLRRQIEAGLVRIDVGRSSAMPYHDGSFDRVLTVNTIYFWEQPPVDVREIRRVLKPGGLFVLVFRAVPDEDGGLRVHGIPAHISVANVRAWMQETGFNQLGEQTKEAPFGPEVITAVALSGIASGTSG
jgi:ubiquinone/menaquinone biosynthesis C-methylase UbiE